MDLQERINVLKQGAEIAQRNGVLTLDEAYLAKQALDALKNNVSHKAAFDILIKVAINAQKKGVYTLKDAHYIYMASENIDSVIPEAHPQVEATQEVSQQEKKTRTKKESV